MTNSEDPDVMLHNTAFHQGLHCLLTYGKAIFKKERKKLFGNYTIGHPKFIASNQKEEFIST